MTVRNAIKNYGLYAAWLVSIIATSGSLYFSEIRGFIPCDLCWFQRIFMYPQVIILGIASYYNDRKAIRYSLPLACIGWCISLLHYSMQKGLIALNLTCSPTSPCTAQWINVFGFITIPFLAWTGFTLIGILLILIHRFHKQDASNEEV